MVLLGLISLRLVRGVWLSGRGLKHGPVGRGLSGHEGSVIEGRVHNLLRDGGYGRKLVARETGGEQSGVVEARHERGRGSIGREI